ncbi:hypothetical protein BGX21_004827 [Mortierella sp. AD011]|nr:hypothetical protein BGX20_007169 [Mortierella sp. AD010]KAF9400182.1 hypothetical protein BGX21_004827 [Mortierella sp. AD011]
MDSYPNPYAALIATFNQVSPLESKDDLDDPQHLPDDDLLLWANAQFTYDIPPGVGIYEDDMGVKLAMSQQQFQQTQQQQQQQQQQQFQQPQQQSHSIMTSQAQQQQSLQYQSADMQRQLQQFDAIHRYLDASSSSEDPRTSLSVVERSRQRNPVSGSVTAGSSQAATTSIHYNGLNSIYPQQQSHSESLPFSSTVASTATTAGPISPAAARLLRQQPFLTLHQQSYSATSSPLSSPTTVSDFHQLQINSPLPVISPKPSEDASSVKRSPSSLSESVSIKAPVSSSLPAAAIPTSLEEKSTQDDSDDEDYENDKDILSKSTKIPKAIQGLSPDDPEYASKLAAEEDKRRRNTAASARFRHKKRLREQILEKTAKEMTAKSELLEARVRELEMEIKWLRGLIVEKDSRMLDAAISSSSSTASPLSIATSALSALSSSSSVKDVDDSASSTPAPKKRGKKAKA